MSNTRYIMFKDTPVAKIQGFNVEILDYDRLPFDLRTKDLDFDMIFHGWTEKRTLNIGKTNAKAITTSLGIAQSNTYAIGALMHFVQFTDCYWIKKEDEELSWEDVSPFRNPLNVLLSKVALTGEHENLKALVFTNHLASPDVSAQGLAAKCLVFDEGRLCLYKISKAEIAASQILDQIGSPFCGMFRHVIYKEAPVDKINAVASKERLDAIKNRNEKIAQCRIMTDEECSLLSWEAFCVGCELHDKDPYEEMKKIEEAESRFHGMNIADYILGNDDRHLENWGFLVDNSTGKIVKMAPLYDHDHAFSDGDLICQTTEEEMSLLDAATKGLEYFRSLGDFNNDLMETLKNKLTEKPEMLSDEKWANLLDRVNVLKDKEQELNEKELGEKTDYDD